MAKSPLSIDTDILSLTIEVEGNPINMEYAVLSCEVFKETYKVSKAVITFWLRGEESESKQFAICESKDFLPGNNINIKAGYDSNDKSIFKGIIVNQGIRSRSEGGTLFVVKCSDESVKLTLGRSSRVFSDQKDSDIISDLVSDHGLTAKVDATTYQHKMLVKHHAIDWDFIVMRAQANGMLVYFEEDKLQVKKPVTNDSCGLKLTYGEDVYSFKSELDARFQMPEVTAKSWSPEDNQLQGGKSKEPAINDLGNISGKKLAEVLGLSGYEIYTTGDISKPELIIWAQAVLQKARLSAFRGEVTFQGNALPQVNKTIELNGFGKRFNGNALITRVTHDIREGEWHTTIGFGLDPEWYFNTQNVNTPLAGGLLPAIRGLQNGVVKKVEADEKGGTKVLVNIPVIDNSKDSIWARLASFQNESGKEKFFRPEIGDEVVLGFLNDDPRYPIVLGILSEGSKKPSVRKKR